MTNTMKHLSLLGRMETDGLMLSLQHLLVLSNGEPARVPAGGF